MLDQEIFKGKIEDLQLNFGLKHDKEHIARYMRFMYPVLKDRFSNDEVIYGFNQLFSMPLEEYNKKYGYGGLPAVADWVNFFKIKSKHQFVALKNKKMGIAIENAKNGIRSKKQIEQKSFVTADKIKKLISTLTKK